MEDQAFKTLKSMLTSRGIKADAFEPVGNQMDETRMYTFGGILIVFSEKSRSTPAEFKNVLAYASENGHTTGTIIVTQDVKRIPDSVIEVLRHYLVNRENTLVQMFRMSHLNLEFGNHRCVPKHRIITESEKTKLMEQYNIEDPKHFPKIDSQDAQVRWIGARPGDILEVTGLCVASASNNHYRYCVPNVYEV